MALAYLCKELHAWEPGQFEFTALVVDHQARPGSSEEAQDVKAKLEAFGKYQKARRCLIGH